MKPLSYPFTVLLLSSALALAWVLGFELSVKLVLLVAWVGFATETLLSLRQ